MIFYSTGEVAKMIGVSLITLKRYIAAKKIPLPPARVGGVRVRLWSEEDIAKVKNLLPKIANGRKTRWQRQREKQKKNAPAGASPPQRARTARAGDPGPVPQKKRRTKKKK